jgi:hypothetical protein
MTQTLSFRDARGHVARVRFRILGDETSPTTLSDSVTVAAGVKTAILALTSLTNFKASGPLAFDGDPAAYPSLVQYGQAETKARFGYTCNPGGAGQIEGASLHKIEIPGPLIAIFKADGETVDNANTNVIALGTALKAVVNDSHVCDASGVAVTHFLGGLLVRRKFQRKETQYSKLPDLSGFQW